VNTKVSFQSASGPLPESIDHGKKEETVFRGRKFSPTVIKELVELEGIEDRACSGRNKNIALAIAALALAAFVLFLTSTSLIILPMGILHTTLLVSGSISMIFSACHFQEKAKSTAKTINRMLQDAPLLGVAA
jgi:hypothetical protein